MDWFRIDNTIGYTQEQLDDLNELLAARLLERDLDITQIDELTDEQRQWVDYEAWRAQSYYDQEVSNGR